MSRPFVPDALPLDEIDWARFVPYIAKANAELARYDGILQSIPNPDVLLSPLITQEAVLSSKIEGTRATLDEVLKYEAQPKQPTEKAEDIQEVINYRVTLQEGRDRLEANNLPLSLRLIRDMHRRLMTSVRGRHRDPGNFRRIQNFIGKPRSTQATARFVPPGPGGHAKCARQLREVPAL
ncbi:MAG: Fic/DOC family N-terminal domain-containing protein [Catalinimonas sp.]